MVNMRICVECFDIQIRLPGIGVGGTELEQCQFDGYKNHNVASCASMNGRMNVFGTSLYLSIYFFSRIHQVRERCQEAANIRATPAATTNTSTRRYHGRGCDERYDAKHV